MAKKYNNDTVQERMAKAKLDVLEQLSNCNGIVASACKAAGISRYTFYEWKKTDPDFAEKVEDIMELQKDFAEALILKKMKDGDTAMIIFYAKTKMKDRGYVERQEVTGADGRPFSQPANVDFSKLTEEQRAVLMQIGEQVLNDTEH